MKKLIYFLLLIFSFCCFFSCSNVNCEYDFAQENKKNEHAQDKVFVTFKLKKETVSRTIAPTEISLESLTDLELYITPYPHNYGIEKFLTNKDSGKDLFKLIKKFSTVEEMENTAIEWTLDFTSNICIALYAKVEGGFLFYGYQTANYIVDKDKDGNCILEFYLEAYLDPFDSEKGKGTGTLDIVFSYPAQIQSVDMQLYRYEDNSQEFFDGLLEIDSANNVFTYKHAVLPADIYELCVTLYADAEKKYPVNKYKEIVVISAGCTSSASRTLYNANEIYKITYDFDGGAEFVENAEYPEYYSLYSEVKLPDVSMIKSYEGKTFDGWYVDDDSCVRLDSLQPGEHNGDIVLKARYCYETDKDGFEALLQTLKENVGYTVKVNEISTADDIAVLRTALNANPNKMIILDLSSCTGLTEIPDYAFGEYYDKVAGTIPAPSITGIIMPDTVEVIGEDAFSCNENLIYANMPKNLKTIKDYAFFRCKRFFEGRELVIPDGCESIGNMSLGGRYTGSGFHLQGSAFTSVIVPDSVTSFGEYVFACCPYLKKIHIGNGVERAVELVQGGAESLETLYLGKNIKEFSMGTPDYYCCPREVYFAGTLEDYLKITFSENITTKVLEKHPSPPFRYVEKIRDTTKLYIDGKLVTDLVIPEGITEIKDYAFYGVRSITSVTIPDSVTVIGKRAFESIGYVKTIRIGSGLKEDDYSGLLNNSTKYYYNGDLESWCKLKEKDFYDTKSVLYINDELVTDLVIPDGVTEIRKEEFNGFSEQFRSITLPASIKKIELYSFESDESDVDIYYQGTMQEWMNIDYTLDDIDTYKGGSGLQFANINLYIDGQLVTDFVIPDGIEEIPDYKFYNFNFSSVSIPDSVKKIGKYAFYGTHLKSVNTGAGCKEVEDSAFANISELEEITFGDSVETIGDDACLYSYSESNEDEKPGSLKKVTLGKSVKSIGENAFYCLGEKGWTDFASPLEEIWYTGDWNGFFGITWGTECFKSKFKLFIDNQEVSNIELSEGVTSINADLINQLGLANESITIPASVTQISGFFGYSVKNIYYKGDIASWCNITKVSSDEQSSIAYKYNLYIGDELVTDLVIPADVTTVAGYSFANCSSLKSVSFEDGSLIKEIEKGAFYKCTNLETVNLCEGLESIGERAFYNCWDYGNGIGIKDFVIPDSVTSLGEFALGYSGIKNLTVGSSLKMLYVATSSTPGIGNRYSIFSQYSDNLDSITLQRYMPDDFYYPITKTFIEQFASIGVVYVPSEEAAQAYKADDDWSKIADIIQVKP